MPLLDHFRSPPRKNFHWESFHSAWPNTIVRQLNGRYLPNRYRAMPQTHLGAKLEFDVGTFDEEPGATESISTDMDAATAAWAPPQATMTLESDLADPDIFEVQVYDDEEDARLVAAIEFVSPGNKDRDEARSEFVGKCASYLRAGVALVIIDIVTTRRANLFVELMELMKQSDKARDWSAKNLYAVALRPRPPRQRRRFDVWPHELRLGDRLPELPLWLADGLAVPLDLEASYEETCAVLRAR